MGTVLTITLPVVLVAYGVWLVVRMVRSRHRISCDGGCYHCPYADGCRAVKPPQPEGEQKHD